MATASLVWWAGEMSRDNADVEQPQGWETLGRPWWQPRPDEVPAILPIVAPIVRVPTMAITLVGVHVYRDGAELRVERRMRRAGETDAEWHDLVRLFMETSETPAGPGGVGELEYGITPHGQGEIIADSLFRSRGDVRVEPTGLSVMRTRRNGTGGDPWFGHADEGLWLWPLPTVDRLRLSARWPAFAVEESSIEIDASRFGELAAHSESLWARR